MVEALRAKHTKNKKNMYRQQRLTLILALVVLFMGGCKKWLKDEELTLNRQPYNSNELKIDGYYYYLENRKIWKTYFFYRNGTLHYGIASDTLDNDLVKYDAWFASDYYSNIIKTDHNRWGLFQIHDDSIVLERWSIQEGGDPVLRVSGHILNDTTFVMTRSEYPYSGEVYQHDLTYHFHQFSPKPDSTNTFIP